MTWYDCQFWLAFCKIYSTLFYVFIFCLQYYSVGIAFHGYMKSPLGKHLSLYDEVPSGYQPCHMVERWKKPTFRGPSLPLYPEDEDRDGLRNVGFFTAQPFDPPDRPRELPHTQSPGKQQISYLSLCGLIKWPWFVILDKADECEVIWLVNMLCKQISRWGYV
jgi:hypothetical protein